MSHSPPPSHEYTITSHATSGGIEAPEVHDASSKEPPRQQASHHRRKPLAILDDAITIRGL